MTATDPKVNELIRLLDEAVDIEECCPRCNRVKDILEELVTSGGDFLPDEFLQPDGEKYARRLLHKDPAGRYSVVVMVWGVGQGTALHDHCGSWCVECVYRGDIRVVSYDKVSEEGDRFEFKQETEIIAGVGQAGALIPPFEYHTIANDLPDRPSVTIHVYAGELKWCWIFVPKDGAFVRERRELCYTSA